MMRTGLFLTMAVGLALAFIGLRMDADDRPGPPGAASDPVEARFRETVRPFLEAYCLRTPYWSSPPGRTAGRSLRT